MSLLQAVIPGIPLGICEFVPTSSSGHLSVVPWFLDWDHLLAQVSRDQSARYAFALSVPRLPATAMAGGAILLVIVLGLCHAGGL